MEIVDGWFTQAKKVVSPNFNDRPLRCEISLLVIHNISLPPGQFGGQYIDQLFTNALLPEDDPFFVDICHMTVSSHVLIDRQGQTTQYVCLEDRSWHAGDSRFQGRENCNDFSIGVELEGADHIPYTSDQYKALVDVTCAIMKKYPAINTERIVGHCDIAPGRKTDPGVAFDWARYRTSLRRVLKQGKP